MTPTHISERMQYRTALECWRLARREAEVYQRSMHVAPTLLAFEQCKAARDAVDRIAQVIRFGTVRRAPRKVKVKVRS